jgi:uroporphyrin-III C-methyltransferase / precorrin-2 dehydrogenase / sirohydrochlorin ferrochelatase
MYPVMLSLKDEPCLVVGGGGVALGKIQGLLAEGARVRVVATVPIQPIIDLAGAGTIDLSQHAYSSSDIRSARLVFATTNDRDQNLRVAEDAKAAGVWANVADDPELCSFHLPARVKRGAFQLAIASAGGAPFVVRRMRQLLERRFGPEWAEWIAAAARFRRALRAIDLPRADMERRYDQFFSATVDGERLTARVPGLEEEAAWLEAPARALGESEVAASVVPDSPEAPRTDRDKPGLVSLVGAGPGDAGLLTLRGRRRLLAANAVVFDRLAATALPPDLPQGVELRAVGKEAGSHPVPQGEINALLIRLARRGKRVVRLKGGDPYVFGRGGEEVEALVEAGIPFEVIPGVTAGLAVPAYAGIPVTHRGEAVRVTLITAHESKKQDGPQVRWDLLAADPHATLVGYMGVTSLPTVTARLIDSGMSPQMPAALIERGSTSGQRVVRATVSTLVRAATDAGTRPPALFVIGPTVDRADTLDWFTRQPLFGERVGMFAPAHDLAEALELAGAEVVEVPLPLTPAARIVIGALPLTGWALRSGEEVDALEEDRDSLGFGPQVAAWCLRQDAADRAASQGWRRVEQIDVPADAARLILAMQCARVPVERGVGT